MADAQVLEDSHQSVAHVLVLVSIPEAAETAAVARDLAVRIWALATAARVPRPCLVSIVWASHPGVAHVHSVLSVY